MRTTKGLVSSVALALTVITGASLAALPASANTYNFSYQTLAGYPSYFMTGLLTTSNSMNGGSPDGYNITNIVGGTMIDPTSTSYSLSLFPGNATPPGYIQNPSWVDYDNSFIPVIGVSSTGGWMFQSSNGFLYNLWLGNGSFNSTPGLVYLYSNDVLSAPFSNIPSGPGEPGNLLVSSASLSTPLPAALPLFAGGLGMIGLIVGRKKRKAAVPAAA